MTRDARTATALAALVLALLAAPLARASVGFGVIEESDEVKHARLKQQAKDNYRAGMEALAAGKTSRGVRLLLWVAKARIDSPYPRQAFDELKKLTEVAAKELEVARELVGGEAPEAGLKELTRIKRTYLGLWPAKVAGRLMADLESDPTFRQVLVAERLLEQVDEARRLEARAEAVLHPDEADAEADPEAALAPDGSLVEVAEAELTPAQRQTRCRNLLIEAFGTYEKVVRQGPDTEAGKLAAAALARLQKKKDLADHIERVRRQRKTREWLDLATNYYRAGRLDLARDYCRKILAEADTGPHADEAKAMLASLEGVK